MAPVARAPPVAVTPRRRVACAGTRARDSSDAVGGGARRACLLFAPPVAAALGRRAAFADEASVKIVRDVAGFGAKEATSKSLVLVKYEGTLASDGAVFDTTLGGRVYATSSSGVGSVSIAPAAARPVVVNLSSDAPVPGVPEGLRLGIRGMRVGGTRTFEVPPELGFGSAAARSPYATIPANSALKYEVTLLRLSDTGPDALYAGISRCGLGGASQMSDGCASVEPME